RSLIAGPPPGWTVQGIGKGGKPGVSCASRSSPTGLSRRGALHRPIRNPGEKIPEKMGAGRWAAVQSSPTGGQRVGAAPGLSARRRAMPEAGDITRLLQEAAQGNRAAAEQLFPLVKERLFAIARARRQGFAAPGLDGSLTCLVDDAFLRLVGSDGRTSNP